MSGELRQASLVLAIEGRPMNMNDRHSHPMVRSKLTAKVRKHAKEAAFDQWGPEIPRLRFPVTVTVRDNCRTANLRDTINAAPSVKAIIDGLTDYGLWPDDKGVYVGAVMFLPAVKTGLDALLVTIEEAPEGTVQPPEIGYKPMMRPTKNRLTPMTPLL